MTEFPTRFVVRCLSLLPMYRPRSKCAELASNKSKSFPRMDFVSNWLVAGMAFPLRNWMLACPTKALSRLQNCTLRIANLCSKNVSRMDKLPMRFWIGCQWYDLFRVVCIASKIKLCVLLSKNLRLLAYNTLNVVVEGGLGCKKSECKEKAGPCGHNPVISRCTNEQTGD